MIVTVKPVIDLQLFEQPGAIHAELTGALTDYDLVWDYVISTADRLAYDIDTHTSLVRSETENEFIWTADWLGLSGGKLRFYFLGELSQPMYLRAEQGAVVHDYEFVNATALPEPNTALLACMFLAFAAGWFLRSLDRRFLLPSRVRPIDPDGEN